jgi:hypothetical protein
MNNKIELNKYGVNKKIKANILPNEEMRKLGFTDFREGYWYFNKLLSNSEITFNVSINKNNIEDLDIYILDEDFGQPYDYQNILEDNPNQQFALKIKNKVEYWMKFLQDNGVLCGHEYGNYI